MILYQFFKENVLTREGGGVDAADGFSVKIKKIKCGIIANSHAIEVMPEAHNLFIRKPHVIKSIALSMIHTKPCSIDT